MSIDAQPTIRGRVFRGLAWSGGSQVALQAVRIVVAVTLARLLAPDDYGLAALALVFASLVLVFSDLAIGAAIVQRKHLDEDDRSTAFWMAVGAGVLFTVIGILLAPAIAGFYGRAEVADLCRALAVTFVITSLACTHEALLVREMEFGKLERRMMAATVVGAIVAVAVAALTLSPWALIAQQIAEAIVSTTLLWAFSSWRPRFRFSVTSLRELAGFSGYLVGHRLLYYFHRNADNILIGRYVGAAALGAYSLAYNIMLFPFSRIAGPIQKVLAPAFARMQDEPDRIADAWIRTVRMVGTISVPALCGIVVVAPDFVHVVLGEKWSAVAPILQILAWVGIVQSLQSLNTDILQSRGRTSVVFRFTILFTCTHLIAFVIGLQWGVIGVAAAYAISTTLVEPVYTVLTAREIGMSPWRMFRTLAELLAAAVPMAAVVLGARTILVHVGVGTFGRLVICVVIGTLVYGVTYRRCVPAGWAELRTMLDGVARRRRSRPGSLAAPAES